MKFDFLVDPIEKYLTQHHELYSAPCKAEYWEEVLCLSLKEAGLGSDWEPNFSHESGRDQTTDCGIKISNKSGTLYTDSVKISGSRLTKHDTLEDKIEFLSIKKEDYIFCLSRKDKDWKKNVKNNNVKRYYFIVIDSNKLNYHEQEWTEKIGKKGSVTGWTCTCEGFSANIQKGVSDQIWTKINLNHCEEIHEIVIK